jgi:hypothetical protein
VENSSSNLNGGIGFNVTGRRNVFRTDKAEKNAGPEWAIGRDNQDGQNNAANGTRISFSSAGGTFE